MKKNIWKLNHYLIKLEKNVMIYMIKKKIGTILIPQKNWIRKNYPEYLFNDEYFKKFKQQKSRMYN